MKALEEYKDKYIIENSPDIEDLKQMVELDKSFYNNKLDRGEMKKCLQWQKICPELYTVLKSGDEVLGYINFIPITKECYDLFRMGKIKDYEIKRNDFLPFVNGENYCLFMSVVVKKESPKSIFLLLIKAFLRKIKKMQSEGVLIKSIVADVINPQLEELILNNNGKYLCQSKNEGKIFEFYL